MMFADILSVRAEADEQSAEFFRRFKQEPGLVHAFPLEGEDDPQDGRSVTIWESREAAMRPLQQADLRREVETSYPEVVRVLYKVLESK
jgi:heme-degrading monooxygenase HmoA